MSSRTSWHHLPVSSKSKSTAMSGYTSRRRRRHSERQQSRKSSAKTQSRRSHRSSANFRSVSSSEARRRFGKRVTSGTKKLASALIGITGQPTAHQGLKRHHSA